MNGQTSLEDLGASLRDVGAAGALEASAEWAEQAWQVLEVLARSGQEFTSQDITHALGEPPSPNAAGAVILNGLKAGLIRNVGWSSSPKVRAHRRRVGVYEGVPT